MSVESTVNHTCPHANCVRLQGFYQGNLVGEVGNETTNTETPEKLILPPPSGAPRYDSFTLIGDTYFYFNHWWIIIDP